MIVWKIRCIVHHVVKAADEWSWAKQTRLCWHLHVILCKTHKGVSGHWNKKGLYTTCKICTRQGLYCWFSMLILCAEIREAWTYVYHRSWRRKLPRWQSRTADLCASCTSCNAWQSHSFARPASFSTYDIRERSLFLLSINSLTQLIKHDCLAT